MKEIVFTPRDLVAEEQPRWLYLVAGKRNIKSGRVKFANVGMASDVDKRLRDRDYRRKNMCGTFEASARAMTC